MHLSVRKNGSEEAFLSQRLKQGGQLSPFQFSIVVEGFQNMLLEFSPWDFFTETKWVKRM